ncbi:MAG: anti-sigma-factor antagonist [Deferribacteraceae bacterium]|jgi:anti-sigma B factor antagonist|nr:anti-sigma-factor antagonist [Deferribacteraceae bacterium]MBZ4672396.1 anti-sigma-factor antagonist [Deferribacteraceae bacterium]
MKCKIIYNAQGGKLMSFTSKLLEDKKIFVVETPERIDAANSPELKDMISDTVSKGIFKIVIDMSKTNFIDSSGLGALVSKISICKNNNGDVRLVVLSDRVLEILEITHLNKILKLYKTVDEAIASFTEG